MRHLLVTKPKEQFSCILMPANSQSENHVYTTQHVASDALFNICMQPSNILFLKIYIYFNFSVLLAVVMHCEDVPQSTLMKPAQMKAA